MTDNILAAIRLWREKRGLTQEQLADAIGVDQKTYSNWERGRSELTIKNLERIAKGLRVSETLLFNIAKIDGRIPIDATPEDESEIEMIKRELRDALESLRSTAFTIDWFNEELHKHRRFSNFKEAETVYYDNKEAIVLDIGYSDKFGCFVYNLLQGDIRLVDVPEHRIVKVVIRRGGNGKQS